jgi:hypothetical protein
MIKRKSGWDLWLTALLWVLFLTLIPKSFNVEWPEEFWYKQLFFAFTLTVAYYINVRYLLPRFFDPGRFLIYGLFVALGVGLVLLSVYVFEGLIGLPEKMHELFRPEKPYNPEKARRWFDFGGFMLILFDFSIGVIVHLIKNSQLEAERRRELEKLQVSTELSYLKSQINPHFFFNTLNNIYALTNIDIDASQKALLKLSALMRYVIYEGNHRQSTMTEEIDFIANYIELMKLRLSKRVTVVFDKPQEPGNKEIAPMILLPFVENAFKHGISSTQPTTIKISINMEGSTLHFNVENSIVAKNKEDYEGHGIGIANTKRRLELLYPGAHSFEVRENEDTFHVSLSIQLS